jgi:hypothetical protein
MYPSFLAGMLMAWSNRLGFGLVETKFSWSHIWKGNHQAKLATRSANESAKGREQYVTPTFETRYLRLVHPQKLGDRRLGEGSGFANFT